MCCRYYFSDKAAYKVESDLKLTKGALATRAGDITPGMATPGIIWNRATNEDFALEDLFWGITSKDRKLIINARAESVTKKSMFADSIRNRRCILPAAGFYEWDASKTKFRFKRADEKPIYLAGFYDLSDNKDSFVILTTAANASMKPVHDRMPVMIDTGNVRDYLKDPAAALEMLKEPMPELDRKSDYEQLSLF
ncbi:MAG: SOS response-associated peptidase [Butyrivibrio sp.]|uniref:SOS response-associated peptidase n=1 Tax=Butyrivibrio sp. TaxID=28121 RepID=UPI0025C72C71|nr:SOS response-associated peptidase [Butyrivibrio sp.]MBQ8030821.1 SOS response-associated peptidase [Butyrivibrio sp.]MBQ9306231.1 SOS response-associated peptidase [Butyrivibrio sp.]